jgi:hypothetical protein
MQYKTRFSVFPLSWHPLPTINSRAKTKCHVFNAHGLDQSFVLETSPLDSSEYFMTAQKIGVCLGHLVKIRQHIGESVLFQIIEIDYYSGDPPDMWIAKLSRCDRSLSHSTLKPRHSAPTVWQTIQ